MRKLAVFGISAVGALLTLAGIAYALQNNSYSASSSVKPTKSGTASSPRAATVSLTFDVTEASGQRPSPLKTYGVGLGPGVVPNTAAAPRTCTSAQVGGGGKTQQIVPAICLKKASKGGANMGSGTVRALIGATNDPNAKLNCRLTVVLIASNKKNHVWIRVDAPGAPICASPQHSAIDGTFVKGSSVAAKGGGRIPNWTLKFTVPPNLLHPITGFDSAVVHSDSAFVAFSRKVRGKRLVYLGTVGCPKQPAGRRQATTTFTAENGVTKTAVSSSACTT